MHVLSISFCDSHKHCVDLIREYGSTLYVGMARKNNGCPYISIASGKLKSSYYSLLFFRKIDFYVSGAIKVVVAQIQIYFKLNSGEQTSYCSVS